MYFYQILNRAP